MGNPVTIIGLVASVASLIDLGAKLVSRINEFSSKTSNVPESFRSLAVRLPLLLTNLHQIQIRINAQQLPEDVTRPLKLVVDNTSKEVTTVQTRLSKDLPSDGAATVERWLKALKSLAREDKVRRAVERIHESVDLLVLHQTTQHVDLADRLLKALSRPSITPPAPARPFGLCLGLAPQIEPDSFIGRESELRQLRDWLGPGQGPGRQHIVSIVGMGGMGKTQLSLAFAREFAKDYSSIFWVNAKDMATLKQTLAALTLIVFQEHAGSTGPATPTMDDEDQRIDRMRRWLSEPGNDEWLLLFDNYDDPSLPGIRSDTGYDIRSFFPASSQGNILITTRSTKLGFSKSLKLQKFDDYKESISVLSERSGRDLPQDSDSIYLAKRLGGLPLALAVAGTYIGQGNISCRDYLDLYESAWEDLVGSKSEKLLEYEERTLSSTWSLSLDMVRSRSEDAAELFKFLAYFSNGDIWYELIQKGACEALPWMWRVTQSKMHFQRAIAKLQEYSLVDMVAGSYQIHPCLHDWLIEIFITPPDPSMFLLALRCIDTNQISDTCCNAWTINSRLVEHAKHLQGSKFQEIWQFHDFNESDLHRISSVADILFACGRFTESERMYQRALQGYEKVSGSERTSILTLKTVNDLGSAYKYQGKLKEAEEMYQRALQGKERILGLQHQSTLDTVISLGNLYRVKGKLEGAEKMFQQALRGYETALGLQHPSTVNVLYSIGILYEKQGKLEGAEQMLQQALRGYETALGLEHPSTVDVMYSLGILYRKQGKLEGAEQMLQQALRGYETALGSEHPSTLSTIARLGAVYEDQNKLEQAEQQFQQTLQGYERSLGLKQVQTCIPAIHLLRNYGELSRKLGKYDEAKDAYHRALTGIEIIWGRSSQCYQSIEASLKALSEEHRLILWPLPGNQVPYRS